MALGQSHDRATIFWSIPFGLLISLPMGIINGAISSLAFVLGGLWLSPDLDTRSIALKRWGMLRGLWWPYRKFMPHRSIFSHGPLIGTSLRVGYLVGWITVFFVLLQLLGVYELANSAIYIYEKVSTHHKALLSLIIGLEGSAWLHLMQDGDPLPTEWRRWHN